MNGLRISGAVTATAMALLVQGCTYQKSPSDTLSGGARTGDTTLCCDANDNCSPAPPPPGVCPADTITTVCDEDNNCVDEDLD